MSKSGDAVVAIRNGGRRVRGFWTRVTGGFELEQLWSQFLSEARSSYGLISSDVDWEAIGREPRRWKWPFRAAWALFTAMLMKLTPARRVILLLALVLVIVQGEIRLGESGLTINLLLVGALLIFVVLVLELADRVTMKRDLEIAREIQQWLVPESAPVVDGIDMAFATRPQNTIAGDAYDAFLRQNRHGADPAPLLIAVADVAGKGVPAALLMATFQASLRTLAGTAASLEEIVSGLDRYARDHNMGGRRFTTAFLAEVDPASGAMHYVNAGHNAPILLRASRAAERLVTGGPPLGLPSMRGKDSRFESDSARLQNGDSLFIFTDGLVEAVNQGGEEFGEERLLKLLDMAPAESASATLNRVMYEVNAFAGTAHQHDVITCLIVKVGEAIR